MDDGEEHLMEVVNQEEPMDSKHVV